MNVSTRTTSAAMVIGLSILACGTQDESRDSAAQRNRNPDTQGPVGQSGIGGAGTQTGSQPDGTQQGGGESSSTDSGAAGGGTAETSCGCDSVECGPDSCGNDCGECSDGKVCDTGRCRPLRCRNLGCDSDAECRQVTCLSAEKQALCDAVEASYANLVCRDHACIPGCTTNEDCAAGACIDGICRYGACRVRADCVDGAYQAAGYIPPGGAEEDWSCVEGQCRSNGCGSDADCREVTCLSPERQALCDSIESSFSNNLCRNSICVPGCSTNSDCPGGACIDQTCRYGECRTTEDCINPAYAAAGYIPPGGAAEDWSCVDGHCQSDGCDSDAECREVTCLSPEKQPLCDAVAASFAKLVCRNRICVSGCSTNADCPGGACIDGLCKFGECRGVADCINPAYEESGYIPPLQAEDNWRCD